MMRDRNQQQGGDEMGTMSDAVRKSTAMWIWTSLEKVMVNLAGRWMDECKFEKIESYGEVIEKELAKASPDAKLVKMVKRPFGFIYELAGATYQVFVKANGYSFKRIA
jgi:hypothetical protein